MGTLGVVLVIATRGVGFDRETLIGDLLTVLAVLCWAGYTVGLRRVPQGVSPLRVTTITTIAGTPGLVLAGLPGVLRLDWDSVGLAAWLAVGYCLGAVAGGGLPALEPKRKGHRRDPHRDLHVSDPAGGRVRCLASPGRATPSAPGRGRGLHHRRGSADEDGGRKRERD